MREMIYPAPPIAVDAPPPALVEITLEVPGQGPSVAWASAAAEEARPFVLYFHGNGENLETLRLAGILGELERLGGFLAVDYPGYGRSAGAPSEASLQLLAEAALDWTLRERPGALPVACGWSLGAAVATRLAARRPAEVAGLAALSAWTSLPEVARRHFPSWMVGLALRERWDSLAAAGRVRCPALVVHGAGDAVIPPAHGRELARALGARWVPIADAGHNDLLGRPEVWTALERFLAEVAAGARG